MTEARPLCAALLLAGALAGCATTGDNPRDPLEPYNRAMFSFNDAVDGAVLKPVAKGYRAVLPGFVRSGVSNFFSNIEDVWTCVNDLLQGKFQRGLDDFGRVFFNSTFGIAGVFDFASDVGMQKNNEDFGQTLGWWGVGSGPYLVLPILGPSTVRDGLAYLAVDAQGDPVWRIDDVPVRNTAVGVRFIARRAELLDATSLIEEASLDKYTFVREAWLQRRRNLVYDGEPPREKDDDDSR